MTRLQEVVWEQKSPLKDSEKVKPGRFALSWRLNLLRFRWIRYLVQNRLPQLLVRALTLAGFIFTIIAGLFGSRVGSSNFAIIFVWIAWWTALKLAFIPLGGRSWCSICPIPMPGEWLQQGGIIEKAKKRLGWNRRWPRKLRGSWLQSGGFLLIGLFTAVTLTDPRVTAWVLAGVLGLAIGMSLIFERRAFCSYLCPIGGFTGLYAKTAPLEVRVKDIGLCTAHSQKTCYQNCPWGLYPVALRDSAQCGLCLECLRNCPEDNIALNLRPFGGDLHHDHFQGHASSRLDEAFLALVMLGSALAFSAVFIGPWGNLKSAAFAIGSPAWLMYSFGFLALNLAVMPGSFALAVWARLKWSGDNIQLWRATASQHHVLLPLGLFAWIAFTISFAFPKFNYVLSVLSDPLGWGWNLLGSVEISWLPGANAFSAWLQVLVLLTGLVWSARITLQSARGTDRRILLPSLPILCYLLLYTLAILWLLIG